MVWRLTASLGTAYAMDESLLVQKGFLACAILAMSNHRRMFHVGEEHREGGEGIPYLHPCKHDTSDHFPRDTSEYSTIGKQYRSLRPARQGVS